MLPGCHRCDDQGADALLYYGSTAATHNLPYLTLEMTGPEPTIPVPLPLLDLGQRGKIVAGGQRSIEVSCDGGPDGMFEGYEPCV